MEERRTPHRHIFSFFLCSKPLNVKLADSDAAGGATADSLSGG